MNMFTTHYEKIADEICGQLKVYMGDRKAIVGLSGGIDSSVIAFLCVRALGPGKVVGVEMPYGDQDTSYSQMVLRSCGGITPQITNIKPMVDAFPNTDLKTDLQLGNIMARVRMIVLYDAAAREGGLVVGTTNKTEAMIGYYTKYGDGAVDIEPIAELYKTEVWDMAKFVLDIPEAIVERKPSAGLWEGQTDEDELGITYKNLDAILQELEEYGLLGSLKSLKGEDEDYVRLCNAFGARQIQRVIGLIQNSEHKRHMPPAFRIK